MRLLWFNLATDVDDPILGFTTSWLQAVAKQVEFIHVITMRTGRIQVPGNVQVYSVGKEKGYSEPKRAVEFYRHLWRILQQDRISFCFSHMMPLFTVMAAPFLKTKGIPLITWHLHPNLTSMLKLAHWLSDSMVTALQTSYAYRHNKVVIIGHGIDTALFSSTGTEPPEEPPLILCVGRLSAVKDHPTLLTATHLLHQRWSKRFRVVVIGAPARPQDRAYVQSLLEQVQELGLLDVVQFAPPVPRTELPFWYRRCTVHVNLTHTGFGDKVAWEAMSCCRVCLVANDGFRDTLGDYADPLLFRFGDAEDLAARLAWVLSLPQSSRAALGAYLRERVVTMHSLERLPEKLLNLYQELRPDRGYDACQHPM